MSIIQDEEFGEIVVHKNPFSKRASFSPDTSGRLRITVPRHYSISRIKRVLNSSREIIRQKHIAKDPSTQRARDAKKRILAKKAKKYLPYRLEYFAKLYGYSYNHICLDHANTCWGSCSPSRTISLNIGLMQVPPPLQDYVLLHELAHLNHMDHSPSFWAEVASHDPNYQDHRRRLKHYSPGV